MSAAQGEEFYGFLREIFKRKLKYRVAERIREGIGDLFGFEITNDEYNAMAEVIVEKNAAYEFSLIVKYMTGVDPYSASPEDPNKPGTHRGLALLYRGLSAVGKIRERLGVTDPSMAAAGTIRSDFGHNIMQNAAHASDSVQRAIQERKIIGFYENAGNECVQIITDWLKIK
jgi:hypothetical protein